MAVVGSGGIRKSFIGLVKVWSEVERSGLIISLSLLVLGAHLVYSTNYKAIRLSVLYYKRTFGLYTSRQYWG